MTDSEQEWQALADVPVPLEQWAEEDGGRLRSYLVFMPGALVDRVIVAGKPPDGATHWRALPPAPEV